MEDTKVKVYDFIKGNLLNFAVVLIGIAYVFYNMVIIKRTDLTVEECIAKAGIGVFVGLLIKELLGENGFTKGYGSQIWIDKLQSYSKTCNMANQYIDRVDLFYEQEEIENKRLYRKKLMMSSRMRYEWFFDNEGNYIENKEQYEKLDKKQIKVLTKCIKVKIYNLNLFSEYDNEIEDLAKPEKTDRDQRAKMLGKNSFWAIFSAIVGAYFVALWGQWDWGSFVSACIQVGSWVCCGIIELYDNYHYVTLDKTNKLTRKMELIIKFVRGCEKGLYEK